MSGSNGGIDMPDEYYDLLAEMQEEEIAMQSFAEEHELEVMWDLLQDSQYVSITPEFRAYRNSCITE